MPITDEQARAAGQALEDAGGNKTKAAEAMGLARSTFRDRLKAFTDRALELATGVPARSNLDTLKAAKMTKHVRSGADLDAEEEKFLAKNRRNRAEALLLKLSEGAFHNPKGFREPATGKHADGRDRAPTLVERLSIIAYDEESFVPRLPSARGEEERRARANHITRSKNFQRRLDAYRAEVGNPVASHRAMNKAWGKLTELEYLTGDMGLAA